MPLTIRPLLPEDTAAMCTLHSRAIREVCARDYPADLIAIWAANPTPQGYLKWQAKGETFHVAATSTGQILGFCSWHTHEIRGLYVHPDHHGQQVGTALIQAANAAAIAAGTPLNYVESTFTAQKFYERHGFIKVGTGTNSISGKETHIPIIVMRKRP